MSKQYRRLMAAADAAGYVLAAPDDVVSATPNPHLEAEFRNGHHQAAFKASKAVATRAVAKLTPAQPLATSTPVSSWLHAAIACLRPKGVAA